MSILQPIIRAVPDTFKLPYKFGRNRLKDWAHTRTTHAVPNPPIAPAVAQYLRADNPKLLDLEKRYEDAAVFDHTFWRGWRKHLNLAGFRGESQYLTQSFDHSPEGFYLAQTVYAEMVDDWNLLHTLTEDGAFKCHAYEF